MQNTATYSQYLFPGVAVNDKMHENTSCTFWRVLSSRQFSTVTLNVCTARYSYDDHHGWQSVIVNGLTRSADQSRELLNQPLINIVKLENSPLLVIISAEMFECWGFQLPGSLHGEFCTRWIFLPSFNLITYRNNFAVWLAGWRFEAWVTELSVKQFLYYDTSHLKRQRGKNVIKFSRFCKPLLPDGTLWNTLQSK